MCVICIVFISAAEQAPQVACVEEVRTSSEDTAAETDSKPVTADTKHDERDHASSTDSSTVASSIASSPSQQNAAVSAESSVNNDSTVTSCSEPESSAVAAEGASLTASSEKPAGDDDDNPELTLLVEIFSVNCVIKISIVVEFDINGIRSLV